ncbi:hypothetical protein QBC46DRAFT_392946 [Diplogelasinospora grovesii]|uniref:Receptor L-domain domain-containing protein n=1 Tax=Diplogelasinospora grovesii TaxID=303347 RepID=A0AAN6N2C4_9PEZI|nr:hypothetical protein QBC46DRAFT_392946 [Diplogelasinospora grovesii]
MEAKGLLFLVFHSIINIIILASVSAATATSTACGSTRIVSQADADALSGCATVTGDIVLATNAAGNISLTGVEVIDGSITTETCIWKNGTAGTYVAGSPVLAIPYMSDDTDIQSAYTDNNCTGLVSLAGPTLMSISQALNLSNLPGLASVSFPKLKTVAGEVLLYGVPSLENLTLPQLASAESFHLVDAQELQSLDLPALNNVTGTFEIQTVGLTYDTYVFSLEFLVSSFIIGGIPKVRGFQLTAGHVGLLEVQGNGFLEFVYWNAIDYNRVDTLSVSGCGSLVFGNMAVDTLIVNGNTISTLRLNGIQTIKTLRIHNNRQLTDVEMPFFPSLSGFGLLPSWQNLEISGNPLLQSARIEYYGNPPIQNLSSMVFTGPFDYAWFSKIFTVEKVWGQTLVASTDPGFNCSYLDKLRANGTLAGIYTCQGTTASMAASSSPSHGAGHRLAASGICSWL